LRILVISDTHIPVVGKELPSVIEEEAKKSDYCLHAGDFINFETFKLISEWTHVYGVCGNMDDSEVRKNLPQKRIIQLEEVKIGLVHGFGDPSNLIYYINRVFQKEIEEIDMFVYGHSHSPSDKLIEGKLYFNPGSPTDRIFTPYRSYGILEIQSKTIKRRIVRIE
jgi:hypothetical protein